MLCVWLGPKSKLMMVKEKKKINRKSVLQRFVIFEWFGMGSRFVCVSMAYHIHTNSKSKIWCKNTNTNYALALKYNNWYMYLSKLMLMLVHDCGQSGCAACIPWDVFYRV